MTRPYSVGQLVSERNEKTRPYNVGQRVNERNEKTRPYSDGAKYDKSSSTDDSLTFEQSSSTNLFWAKAWTLVGDVYVEFKFVVHIPL